MTRRSVHVTRGTATQRWRPRGWRGVYSTTAASSPQKHSSTAQRTPHHAGRRQHHRRKKAYHLTVARKTNVCTAGARTRWPALAVLACVARGCAYGSIWCPCRVPHAHAAAICRVRALSTGLLNGCAGGASRVQGGGDSCGADAHRRAFSVVQPAGRVPAGARRCVLQPLCWRLPSTGRELSSVRSVADMKKLVGGDVLPAPTVASLQRTHNLRTTAVATRGAGSAGNSVRLASAPAPTVALRASAPRAVLARVVCRLLFAQRAQWAIATLSTRRLAPSCL
jgi:hypothetical protein